MLIGFVSIPDESTTPAVKIMCFNESTLPEVANVINASTTSANYLLCQLPFGYMIDMTTTDLLHNTMVGFPNFKGILIKHDAIIYQTRVNMENSTHDVVRFPSVSIQWTEELLLTELSKVGIVFSSYI